MRPLLIAPVALLLALIAGPASACSVLLHGRPFELPVFGAPASERVAIVSSGDGGWVHLAPHVTDVLVARGYQVIAIDSRAYLSHAVAHGGALSTDAVADDYNAVLQTCVTPAASPVLIGVSEGAGLSVVAAASPRVQSRIRGVVALGLSDRNELAWHWRDAVIYVTKGVPNEPLFHAAEFLPRVSPVPVALVQSSHDEFVPAAEAQLLARQLRSPSRVITVEAADHRFSNRLPELDARLVELLQWIDSASAD